MAACFARDGGAAIGALLLIAGAFPPDEARMPDAWPAPANHVHGTTNGVLDIPLGPDGSDTWVVELQRRGMGCGARTRRYGWQAVSWPTPQRHEWDCAKGVVTTDVD